MTGIEFTFYGAIAVAVLLSGIVSSAAVFRAAFQLGHQHASLPASPSAPTSHAPLGHETAASPRAESFSSSPGTLAILEFNGGDRVVEITKASTIIGRDRTDDVRLNDIRVSRGHARLQQTTRGTFEIHNETASRSEPNALLVNGVYREHAPLKDGDTISLGGISFVLRLPKASQSTHTGALGGKDVTAGFE